MYSEEGSEGGVLNVKDTIELLNAELSDQDVLAIYDRLGRPSSEDLDQLEASITKSINVEVKKLSTAEISKFNEVKDKIFRINGNLRKLSALAERAEEENEGELDSEDDEVRDILLAAMKDEPAKRSSRQFQDSAHGLSAAEMKMEKRFFDLAPLCFGNKDKEITASHAEFKVVPDKEKFLSELEVKAHAMLKGRLAEEKRAKHQIEQKKRFDRVAKELHGDNGGEIATLYAQFKDLKGNGQENFLQRQERSVQEGQRFSLRGAVKKAGDKLTEVLPKPRARASTIQSPGAGQFKKTGPDSALAAEIEKARRPAKAETSVQNKLEDRLLRAMVKIHQEKAAQALPMFLMLYDKKKTDAEREQFVRGLEADARGVEQKRVQENSPPKSRKTLLSVAKGAVANIKSKRDSGAQAVSPEKSELSLMPKEAELFDELKGMRNKQAQPKEDKRVGRDNNSPSESPREYDLSDLEEVKIDEFNDGLNETEIAAPPVLRSPGREATKSDAQQVADYAKELPELKNKAAHDRDSLELLKAKEAKAESPRASVKKDEQKPAAKSDSTDKPAEKSDRQSFHK